MSFIIKDMSAFDELAYKKHDIAPSTFYNAKRGRPVSKKTYENICKRLGREIEAEVVSFIEGFSIDMYVTDHELKKKWYKSFHDKDPDIARNNAIEYLRDPDNVYDIRREDQLTEHFT